MSPIHKETKLSDLNIPFLPLLLEQGFCIPCSFDVFPEGETCGELGERYQLDWDKLLELSRLKQGNDKRHSDQL